MTMNIIQAWEKYEAICEMYGPLSLGRSLLPHFTEQYWEREDMYCRRLLKAGHGPDAGEKP